MDMLIHTIVVSAASLFVLMTLLWAVGMRMNNAAIVDVGWGLGYVVVAVIAWLTIEGVTSRQAIITLLVSLWGLRLAWHLLVDRILGGKPEEGRYVDIRARWNTNLPLKFFFFYQAQAVLIVILSLPFYLISVNPGPDLSWIEIVGVVVWLSGFLGESIADRQLKLFKADPANKGKTCQVGLWSVSRHPNYFFEWVIWMGYFIIALSAPNGWLAIVSPVAILYVLLRVTGIPLTEIQAVKSRGDEYRRYQRTTSAFVPWFKKQVAQS